MGESSDSSSWSAKWGDTPWNPRTFLQGEVKRIKDYWSERFAFLENYSELFFVPEQPLPEWSTSDVEEFIASDPVHGPALKIARKTAEIAATGSAIGAVTTAAQAWKYSKSPHGAALAFGAGAVFGWTFGHEIANHWFQLYRLDTMAAQREFLEWWKNKCGELGLYMRPS